MSKGQAAVHLYNFHVVLRIKMMLVMVAASQFLHFGQSLLLVCEYPQIFKTLAIVCQVLMWPFLLMVWCYHFCLKSSKLCPVFVKF